MTLEDLIYDPIYNLTMVLPAKLAAPTLIEWAAMICNTALGLGLRRLAIRAAAWAYDLADHDPADSCWELHRARFRWAYSAGSFRPAYMSAAAVRFRRRYGDLV